MYRLKGFREKQKHYKLARHLFLLRVEVATVATEGDFDGMEAEDVSYRQDTSQTVSVTQASSMYVQMETSTLEHQAMRETRFNSRI